MEEFFKRSVNRKDLAILLITQPVANSIRHLITPHVDSGALPTILEIASKDVPYNPAQDPIMQTVVHLLGGE